MKKREEYVIVDRITGAPAKNGSYPILWLVNPAGHKLIYVRRDDGRINVQFPDGDIETMTREYILALLEGSVSDGARKVKEWLSLS